MPNHVTHRVLIVGEAAKVQLFIETFLTTVDRKENEPEFSFDFERITPMPAILRESESSSLVSHGLALLGRTDIPPVFGRTPTLEQILDYAWVRAEGITTVEELTAFLDKTYPQARSMAEVAIKAYEETGYTSWYSWSIENWGTKWNAYDFVTYGQYENEDNMAVLEFGFDTAWSPPVPIFEALAKRLSEEDFAGLHLSIAAFDEGWNFAWIAQIEYGVLRHSEVDATAEIYEKVYGHPPASCEDDEDEQEPAVLTQDPPATPTL